MANAKSRSGTPVIRQQNGKQNPLISMVNRTSQPNRESTNRLNMKKLAQSNTLAKSKSSLFSNKCSSISIFGKNHDKKIESQSAISVQKERNRRLLPGTKTNTDDRKRPLNNTNKVDLKERKTKDLTNAKHVLKVYKSAGRYTESTLTPLSENYDTLQECGDVNGNMKKEKQHSELREIFSITTGTGHKLCKDFITYVEKIRFESPDDDDIFHEKCLSRLKYLEEKINNQLFIKKQEIDCYIHKLEAIKSSKIDSIAILDELERDKVQMSLCIEAYKGKLKEAEERWGQTQEMPKQLIQDLQARNEEQDKEILRISNINQSLEDHKRGVDMKNEVLLRELFQCEMQITNFRDENENLKENISKVRSATYEELENHYKESLDRQNNECEQMKMTLLEKNKQIDELKAELAEAKTVVTVNDEESPQLLLDLEELNAKYKELESLHEMLLQENKNLAGNKTETDKAKINYDENIAILEKERDEAVSQKNALMNTLFEKERILETFELTKTDDYIYSLKQEIETLHVQISNILEENDELKKQTLKMKVQCRAAEETNIMNQRLLKIRGELVKYFHESKDKCSIHDIYPGLSKSNANCDSVSLNYNDLQKLSSSLDSKDTDLASKVHMIRYLEDNENCYKQTITKLRDYNSRLENENNDLKRLMRMESQTS